MTTFDDLEFHAIKSALIGDRWYKLYYESPTFREKVDLFVRLLPDFVNGLAYTAEVEDAKFASLVAAVRNSQMFPEQDLDDLVAAIEERT